MATQDLKSPTLSSFVDLKIECTYKFRMNIVQQQTLHVVTMTYQIEHNQKNPETVFLCSARTTSLSLLVYILIRDNLYVWSSYRQCSGQLDSIIHPLLISDRPWTQCNAMQTGSLQWQQCNGSDFLKWLFPLVVLTTLVDPSYALTKQFKTSRDRKTLP